MRKAAMASTAIAPAMSADCGSFMLNACLMRFK